MKIYTKTGDSGETGLFAGPRVRKDHPRIEAYGTVDELNAVLGLVRTEELPTAVDHLLTAIQNELFALGAELATPDALAHGTATLAEKHIEMLERAIDHYEDALPPLKQFILPGGTRTAALLHIARTVARRAERLVVSLSASPAERIRPQAIIYLNRLSDLLFVLARAVNASSGVADTPWAKPE